MLGHQVELADHATGLRDIAQGGVNRFHTFRSSGQCHRQDWGLHGDLGLGLDLTQLLHGLAGPSQQLGGSTGGGLDIRVHDRPGGAMHGTGTGVHPAPHFLGGVRQVRGQQTCEGVQAQTQSGAGGLHSLLGRHIAVLVRSAIGAVLDQLDVVVAELPEVGLDDFQRLGMLVGFQRLGGLTHHQSQLGHSGAIQRFGHIGRVPRGLGGSAHVMVLVLTADGQRELGGVQQLDGQSTANLHLADVVRGIEAQASGGGPVTHGVRAELLDRLVRHHDVALGLRHLLVVGVQNPAGQRGMGPRQALVLQVRAVHSREQPGADDVLTLRAQVHREGGSEQGLGGLVRLGPVGHDLRGQRRGGPSVHDVLFGGETTGHITLGLVVALRHVDGRVDRQTILGRSDRVIVIRLAGSVHRVPQRERDAEEALTGDQPVAVQAVHPVLITHAHEVGVELEFLATLDKLGVQLGVGTAVLQIPLAGGDDLERLVALLVEVRHTLGRGRLAVQIAGLAQLVDDDLAGGERGLASGFGKDLAAGRVLDPVRGIHHDTAVALDDRAGGQLQVAPPLDVGYITERTAHGDTGTLVHFGGRVRQNRHLDLEQRGVDVLAEVLLVAFVVRVGDQRGAGRQQFGAGGLDVDRGAVLKAEGHLVVEAGVFARFELGLGHGGLEGHIPQAGGVLLVGLATGEVAQEGLLGHTLRVLTDGVVGLRPVDGQTQLAPQGLKQLLILSSQTLAQLDEVLAGNRHLILGVNLLAISAFKRRLEVRVVRQRHVHAHAIVVLHAALGRQAVVIPTHRVEHVVAAHALVARNHIGVRVREHVTHVQRTGDGGRRGVDGVDGLAVAGVAEFVGAVFIPDGAPLVLKSVHADLVGQRGEVGVDDGFAFSHKAKVYARCMTSRTVQ